ncbi:putative alcohol dehydrogenase [Rhexocercosporidium sp. MPI-PUGE-AT-0058]|nr:putative alcohol dehydrogenase [Rhexocercosporidium sp. MPI-PUGE-AT-0058]
MSSSTPTSYKASVLPKAKASTVIETRSLPEIGPDEVAIKITAAAINPVDWKMRDYDEFLPSYPTILGSDAAGTVLSTGSSVTDFFPNDRVFFQGIIGNPASSTFQQYSIMPSSLLGRTPSSITDVQAAGISLATMAVVTAFYDTLTGHGLAAPWSPNGAEAGKGKAVAIIGGSSSVGQYAIQLARLSGFEKIVTNASKPNHELLKQLGATAVLDRSHASAADFADAIGEAPLEMVFDAISASATQVLGVQVVQAVKSRGGNAELVTVHTVHPAESDAEAVGLGKKGYVKVEVKQVLGIGSQKELRYLSEPLMKALGGEEGWIAKGLFRPMNPKVVEGGLRAVEEAMALNKMGVSGIKVVIKPWDE